MKKIGKVCGLITILSPLWLSIIKTTYELLNFNSGLYLFCCIGTVVLCIVCLIVSIIVDIKYTTYEKEISQRNKKFVIYAIVLGMALFTCLFIYKIL